MITMICSLLLGYVSLDRTLYDRVDLVEFNTYDDGWGVERTVAIFYVHHSVTGEYQVVDWRWADGEERLTPERRGMGWVVTWWDRKTQRLREVQTSAVRYTRTPYDAEVLERGFQPRWVRPLLRGRNIKLPSDEVDVDEALWKAREATFIEKGMETPEVP